MADVRPDQVCAGEVRPREVRAGQVGAGKVPSGQVGARAGASLSALSKLVLAAVATKAYSFGGLIVLADSRRSVLPLTAPALMSIGRELVCVFVGQPA